MSSFSEFNNFGIFKIIPSFNPFVAWGFNNIISLANSKLLEKGSFTFDHNNYKLDNTDPKSLFNARKSSVETEHKKGLIKNLEQF